MSKAFQKAKFYQNLTTESGSKQRFSLLQEKAVIQAMYLKGGLWVCTKSQNISTASDQYFLSYVKKNTGGGVKLTLPPPAGIGLKFKTVLDIKLYLKQLKRSKLFQKRSKDQTTYQT